MNKMESMSQQHESAVNAMTGGQATVASLRRWNVDLMFGVPGVQLDHFFDAVHKANGALRLIHTRHEQGAAYMALGYAMTTGRPAVFTVVPGPGLLNAGAALSTAYACNAPVLCITSTIASSQIGRNHGLLHEIPDQAGLLRGLTKWSARANTPSEVPALIDEAFRQMLTGRPRPVAIEIPIDVLGEIAAVGMPRTLPALTNPPVDAAKVEAAAKLLRASKNPMIVVGGGAMRAGDEVRALAEKIQAPVVSRQMGRGVLSDRHDLALPAAAAIDIWKEVDVVVGIGTRLQQLREWGWDENLKTVRIDLDPLEMTRVIPATVGLVADAGDGAAALLAALAGDAPKPSRTAYVRELKQKFRARIEKDVGYQLGFIDILRAEMPDDAIFVDEMTQMGYAAKFGFPVYAPNTFVTSSYQGTLGYGFATALGAQAGNPGRKVVSVNGDGGFMYTMPELASAVLHKIPLVAIVFADGNFGNVKRIQTDKYGGRLIASNLHNPDFKALAENFGALGLKATDLTQFRSALRQAFAAEGPVLIEVPMDLDKAGSPWHHIHGRKMRP